MTSPRTDGAAAPRVAVVGCGYWGRNLVRNFHELGALAAVSEADPQRAAELEGRFGVPSLAFEDVLLRPDIEGVAIATPAGSHAALALRALDAGKHVFVEKPLALKVEDAERVRSAAKARDRVVMVGHLLRYHPAFIELHRQVAEGRLGRLRYIYSNRLNLGRFRREEDVFWSFAPHDLSMIIALAGTEPDRVESVGCGYLHETIADVTTTHLRFPGGLNAHIFVSWLHPFKEQKLVVVGEEGMAVFDDRAPWPGKLVLYPHRIAWRGGAPEPVPADAQPVAIEPTEPLRMECLHFLDCARENRRPVTDLRDGIGVLRVLDAARRSLGTGGPVSLMQDAAGAPYFVHPSSFVDEECSIGPGTRIWHFSHILPGSRIGRDCTIGQNVAIGPDVTVGDGCKIQNNVSLYKGVRLGDGVFCGPSCVFTNVNTPRAEVDRKADFRPTPVGRGATIGANATVVCGHSLGDYCFVAAGAVVTRDVPAHALVAGNPARQIGWVSHAGERLGEDLVCPRTGARYEIDGEGRLVEATEVRRIA
ncbi:Gfo/Idh/MocA family oxidoreductase [Arenibaculum pallidiluteum]|uniref:Gfo/Idh/MocA family oxidoreductase n=1 Tax=Arenibaculum pallidiluteum TaxID=2812559 RepID=UPI001A96FE54|nr:Gfo/Idh/MocA family oxidoreductase [Arenibaculum pallidiluteum]